MSCQTREGRGVDVKVICTVGECSTEERLNTLCETVNIGVNGITEELMNLAERKHIESYPQLELPSCISDVLHACETVF